MVSERYIFNHCNERLLNIMLILTLVFAVITAIWKLAQ